MKRIILALLLLAPPPAFGQAKSTVQQTITGDFSVLFNRRPTDAELQYWVNNYAAGMSLDTIYATLQAGGPGAPPPASAPLPAAVVSSIDPVTFVTCLYLTFLHRAPDQAGLSGWVSGLSGGMSQQQVIDAFIGSDEFKGMTESKVYAGGPTDVADASFVRQASYSGGTPGFVNSAVRASTFVGPSATAFEWSLVGKVDSQAAAGENVGVYGQGYGRAAGPIWGMVAECHAFGAGNCIGLEVDTAKVDGSPGVAGGIDIVNYGNMSWAIRTPNGRPIWQNPLFPDTQILSTITGGFQIVVHGVVRATWE